MINSIFILTELSRATNAIKSTVNLSKRFNTQLTFFDIDELWTNLSDLNLDDRKVRTRKPIREEVEKNVQGEKMKNISMAVPELNEIEHAISTCHFSSIKSVGDLINRSKPDITIFSINSRSRRLKRNFMVIEKIMELISSPVLVLSTHVPLQSMDKISLALGDESLDNDLHLDILAQFLEKFNAKLDVVNLANTREDDTIKNQNIIYNRIHKEFDDCFDYFQFRIIVRETDELMTTLGWNSADMLVLTHACRRLNNLLLEQYRKQMTRTEIPLLVLN